MEVGTTDTETSNEYRLSLYTQNPISLSDEILEIEPEYIQTLRDDNYTLEMLHHQLNLIHTIISYS